MARNSGNSSGKHLQTLLACRCCGVGRSGSMRHADPLRLPAERPDDFPNVTAAHPILNDALQRCPEIELDASGRWLNPFQNYAQYPSVLFRSLRIDPSAIRMNGRVDFQWAASWNGLTKSSPVHNARKGLEKLTLGSRASRPLARPRCWTGWRGSSRWTAQAGGWLTCAPLIDHLANGIDLCAL